MLITKKTKNCHFENISYLRQELIGSNFKMFVLVPDSEKGNKNNNSVCGKHLEIVFYCLGWAGKMHLCVGG